MGKAKGLWKASARKLGEDISRGEVRDDHDHSEGMNTAN